MRQARKVADVRSKCQGLWAEPRWPVEESLLLQQGGDVDVPANGLAVEAAGEQVAGGVVLTPGGAAHHAAVTLRRQRNTHAYTLSFLLHANG